MITQTISQIISIIIIIYIWQWIINFIGKKKLNIKIIFEVFGLCILFISTIMIYKPLINYIGLGELYFLETLSVINIFIFTIYITIIVSILSYIYQNTKIIKTILILSIILIITSSLLLYTTGQVYGSTLIIGYIIIGSYTEEILKFIGSKNILFKNKNYDLIFICLLIGFGFSTIENIIFFIKNIIFQNDILINRNLITTLIHTTSTGIIGYINIILNKKIKYNNIVSIIIGIIGGISIHTIYNISIYLNQTYITILLGIISYIILSYLIFNSNTFFITKNTS